MPAFTQSPGAPLATLLTDVLLPEQLGSLTILGLQLDSRKVKPGDLFFAVPGVSSDGRDFIGQALDSGAVVVLAEADGLNTPHPNVIAVAGLTAKISDIAARFYGNPSAQMEITGITGTNGKTTCSFLLGQLLGRLSGKSAIIGTLGFGVCGNAASDAGDIKLETLGMTTPDAVKTQYLLAAAHQAGAKSVVMEVSSHSLEQSRVSAVAFDTAIFTNLSRDHLDYHQSMDAYRDAKIRLFQQPGLKTAILNLDDPMSQQIQSRIDRSIQVIGYGLKTSADVNVADIKPDARGFSGVLHSPWGAEEFRLNLLGEFNLLNMMAVVSAACSQGYSLASVLAEMPFLKQATGRMQRVSSHQHEPQVFVDYAHTPDALAVSLQALRKHLSTSDDGSPNPALWVVFGCGGDRDKGKRPEMGAVANALADKIIITSDNPRTEQPLEIIKQIAAAVDTPRLIENRQVAIETAIAEAQPTDYILIAGKGHEDYQQLADRTIPFSDIDCAREALLKNRGQHV